MLNHARSGVSMRPQGSLLLTHPTAPASVNRRVLIIVENLPVPFDRRVWSEATTLRDAGYTVSIICPKAPGYEAAERLLMVFRFIAIVSREGHGVARLPSRIWSALFWEFLLALRVARRPGFDVIHACNPPDLIFIIGMLFKVLGGKSFIFDHHDLNPELYEAKFGRRDFFWNLLVLAEKLTFKIADLSIATNELYRHIAINRGGMRPDRVFVVRSGPNLDRVKNVAVDPHWRNGRRFLVGYVGVISEIEGLDLLLAAVHHIVHTRRRSDIQFVIVGSGP